ncbi:MAG: UvrD-helicase domain-containing protein [Simkania sp.]|nr:UvrD-helicase domain-containing protein [Simkania sp.]
MIEELSLTQQQAATHLEGPMLVLAGAGSGKTRIVTQRIAYLLQLGIPSSEILAVTFTNKAAEELRERVRTLTHQNVLTCTFHSLCAKILRSSIAPLGYSKQFIIYDEEDSEKVLKECLATLGIPTEKGSLKTLRTQISQAKNALLDPEKIPDDEEILKKTYRLYQERLKLSQALDFDDLLLLTARLFTQHPEILELYRSTWSFLLIDEYQDTNFAQYELIRLLSIPRNNLFVVGDPDQSIYSWRGARVQNILNFANDFPGAKVITLEQNYRSRNQILKAANALIRHNHSRYEKDLWSTRGEGDPITLFIAEDDRSEAWFVVQKLVTFQEKHPGSLRDCAIFYRTNAQSRTFEDALLRQRVPYIIVGGISFYQRKEIKDLLSLLNMVDSGADLLSFSRTINLPKRGFGEVAIGKIKTALENTGITIFEACERICLGELPCKLSAKQMEGLVEYVESIHLARNALKSGLSLHETLSNLIEKIRYLEALKEDPETYQDRRENIAELVSKAAEWEEDVETPRLSLFLEELSLKSSLDESEERELDAVRLMTLHNSKGLEFDFVALVGMEEELFPHVNSRETTEAIEEERRLCYVGMTRAKEELCLTAAKYRYLWGTPRTMRPSRFLQEIPREYLTVTNKERSTQVDEDEEFSEGSKVYHRDYGTGIVQKSYTTSLGLTYDVLFEDTGIERSLVAKYAKLGNAP